jgi:EAL domain-containing protein (putative c-di-GMP-specific phosphodiesterase class I)/CheY-like chemotaxis protein
MMNEFIIKILILDDEFFMHTLLAIMLENLGYTSVSACADGHVALELIDSPNEAPNLILLDLNMPEMDGLEFVRRLVERHYTGSLILISGEDERMRQAAEKLAQAHKITVLGHLHKPATQEGLAALIRKWMAPQQVKPRALKKIYDAHEVHAAIANNELVNHYQPKVAVATRQVVGVETLVRWNHPQDGMVFPDQFISVAESHGLIDDLTQVVLVGALTQTKIWMEAGLNLQVAVNLSMDNLASLDFADLVVRLATKAGVPSHMVGLEVTETSLMKDLRTPLEILTRLRLKRFLLSIDDFGTGNSSLSQLRDLPFDELKIDQSFVHSAWRIKKLSALFDSSLRLAKQLGMKVVAEGVEDQNDWDFLSNTECDIAQGYFIAKPMPAADLPGWIHSWQSTFGITNGRIQAHQN